MILTSLALGLALTATPALAGDKQAMHQEMNQIAQEITLLKASGSSAQALRLQARYDALSARLGGDDPAAQLSRPLDLIAPAVQNAVTTVPPGSVGTTTNFASAPALPIVDNTVNVDSLVVSGVGTYLWDLDVTVDITHTWASDLDIYIVHDNSGTRISLTTDNGGSNDDVFVGTVFDDSEAVSAKNHIYADLTPTGPLSPEGNLRRLLGLDPNSSWTLEVGDDAGGDTGVLNTWSIDVTTFAAPPAAPGGPTTISNTTPIPILDNTLQSDTMIFSGLGNHTAKVTLYTEITHTWAGDLDITLVSPSGTRVDASFSNGGSNDDIFNGTAWSDDTVEGTNVPSSERLVTEVIFVNLTPEPTLGGEDSFSRFIGEDPNGTWTLEVFDGAGGDTGSINRWDVSIEDYLGAPPPIVNYCTAGTTQNGCNAIMSGSGTPSLSNAGAFTITANTVEGGKSGILFYGITGRNASPWGIGGSSFLCVKAPTQRTSLQNSGGTNGLCDGSMALDWNGYVAANPLKAINLALVVGSVVDAQGWFRDQGSPRNTSLTDGLEFTVSP